MPTRSQSPPLPDGVHTVTHAADLPRAGWDALTGPLDLFLTCRWLEVSEAMTGAPTTYLWTERDGVPTAGLVTVLATAEVPWALSRPDAVLRNSAEEDLPGARDFLAGLDEDPTTALMPSLLGGGRHIGNTRILRGASATGRDVEALVAAAETLARRAGAASVCFLYVEDEAEPDRALDRILAGRGYETYVSGRYATLRVPPGGYDEYLAALPRKRRASVATERRRIRAADVHVAQEPLAEADFPRFGELETALLGKYGIAWHPARSVGQLREIRDRFGPDAMVMVARAEGAVRGFALVLRHGDHWYARQTGYDYAYQHRTRAPLPFEVLYYRLVEEAAAAGVSTIHYGMGGTDTKRFRGCVATDQRCHLLRLEPVG